MSEKAKFDSEKERSVPELSRRQFVAIAAAAGFVRSQNPAKSSIVRTDLSTLPPYGNGTIAAGIRSRVVANVNGLNVHMLEAGFEKPGRRGGVLLDSLPELPHPL